MLAIEHCDLHSAGPDWHCEEDMTNTAINDHHKSSAASGIDPASPLTKEYEKHRALFEAQPPMVQRYLETQARTLAEALMERPSQIKFNLPDRVVVHGPGPSGSTGQTLTVPAASQEQMAGGLFGSLTRADIRPEVRNRLSELEGSSDAAVAAAAGLMRYAAATHMVYTMLPSGRTVSYRAAEGEEIPTIPVGEGKEASALTADSDAIAEEGVTLERTGPRDELLVPYVPSARRFYLPQWVAFDDEGQMLVKSSQEATAHIASMQRFLEILHAAVGLAPFMVADPEYQRKRYGILGQLINQGRALATHETREICDTIRRRASAGELNRGLSLSLPYFDDQDLDMKLHNFQVIPAGRIMFVPAFVVRAAQEEQAKVAQDTRLNASTRKYLLNELDMLYRAFLPDAD
jgi:hypothetical protein